MAFVAYRTWTTGEVVTASHMNQDVRDNGDYVYDHSVRRQLATKTTTYTLTDDDDVILADASGGAFTLTLPTAVGIAGRTYEIKKIDSSGNAVTVDGNGAETIDGAATLAIGAQHESYTLVSDGANWRVV